MELVSYMLIATLLLLFWAYLGYPILLAFLTKIRKGRELNSALLCNNQYEPHVSIIIPTYNEEKVIWSKMKNCLELDYPKDKLEIIVVDSASTDRTREIIEKFRSESVKLIVQSERRGKAVAINEALKHANGEIILLTDANAYLDKRTLKHIVKHFQRPIVGGVEGKYVVSRNHAKPTNVIAYEESLFRTMENWIRERESMIDSVVGMVGELFAFRNGVINKFDENAIAEDFDASITIRKKGYVLIHEPNAVVLEPSASSLSDEIKQKMRRAVGTIQALFKHYYVLLNPKYGLYGVLILPSHKLLQVISPFLLILLMTLSIADYMITGNILLFTPALVEVLCAILGVAVLLGVKFNRGVKNPIVAGIGYFLLMQLIVLLAWWEYLTGSYSVKWEKIESSRGSPS